MRTYGQCCRIARADEILAERWTPIINCNLLLGSSTLTARADDAPGISRALLATRRRSGWAQLGIQPQLSSAGSR